MAEQLTFDLGARPALGRSDFFVAPANAAALALVDARAAWPNGRMVLVGPEGSGKSHLAAVVSAETGAPVVGADVLAGARPDRLAAAGTLVVEDADRTLGAAGEEALFHLSNLMQASGGRLLLTARTPPGRWDVGLPDLASRMQASGVATLSLPDDALLAAVLVKQFADRQIVPPAALIPYLVARIDRSFAAAAGVAARLDAAALAEGRGVTRALAARVLGGSDGDMPPDPSQETPQDATAVTGVSRSTE